MNFKGKRFIISGASSGIGRCCAEMLLDQGASVVGIDLREASIIHEQYEHRQLDVSEEEQVSAVLDEVEDKFGRLDGLLNCAGTFASGKPFFEIPLSEWNQVIATNLTGVFVLSKYAALKMTKYGEGGKIVNISCIRSKIFRPNMADYAASKGAVVALTSAMALDLAPYNIRVNSIAPGFTYTGMTARSFDNPAIRESSEKMIPLSRLGQPEDVAKVALFLLSDLADYIHGETIFVDGGFAVSK